MNDTLSELPFPGEVGVSRLPKDCFDAALIVPSEDLYSSQNGHCLYPEVDRQIAESLEKLSTRSDSEAEEKFRKRVRVGNHYQARIPKHAGDSDYAGEDELLWDPLALESPVVDGFLKRVADLTRRLLPMGTHLRDDERALYVLQQHQHDVEGAVRELGAAPALDPGVWSEEECRNFERGLLAFGKNFFLIQKYRVRTRGVGELVQFYYLWKKTERYDLFAHRIRGSKKKYALNPGISDLMCRYLGRQGPSLGSDVQLIVSDAQKSGP